MRTYNRLRGTIGSGDDTSLHTIKMILVTYAFMPDIDGKLRFCLLLF
jgi:hypothetical protein